MVGLEGGASAQEDVAVGGGTEGDPGRPDEGGAVVGHGLCDGDMGPDYPNWDSHVAGPGQAGSPDAGSVDHDVGLNLLTAFCYDALDLPSGSLDTLHGAAGTHRRAVLLGGPGEGIGGLDGVCIAIAG